MSRTIPLFFPGFLLHFSKPDISLEQTMHKTIGIIGGMTPESTTIYYNHIIHTYQKKIGDYAFPEILIYSVSFQKIVDWMNTENWEAISDHMINIANALKQAGADFALLATNTIHNVFDTIQTHSPIPFMSIVEATAENILEKNLETIGLLGTRFTMQKSFFKDVLKSRGVETLVPSEEEQEDIHRIIFDELGRGVISESSRNLYLQIITRLEEKGAQGIILGCTELPLLIGDQDCDLPLFDTARIHAEKALNMAME